MSLIHSKNHVTNIDEKSIQPNAVDIRCSELVEIWPNDGPLIEITENGPKMFWNQMPAKTQRRSDGKYMWLLEENKSYQFETEHEATIPEGMAGWLIIRSTLSRNGIIMSSGLYDQGFRGKIGGTLHNLCDRTILLERNCRIGQFIMATSEGDHLYDGFYNKNGGRSIA